MKLKFIHIADLHLDTPFSGIAKINRELQKQLIEAAYKAFERCISIAINQSVDFVLIAGDIYDAAKQTIAAKHFFYQQMERLDKAAIPVVMIHGNHDYLQVTDALVHYPQNIHVLSDDTIQFVDLLLSNNETVRVYGFSYNSRWIREKIIDQYPINPKETDFTIGLLHGDVETKDIKKDLYAPFTVTDLLSKQYDYWALGHIHQALQLYENPLILYPGTIQGKHALETGDKGAYLIELSKHQSAKKEFISLASIIWEKARLICQSNWQITEFVRHLQQIQMNYLSEAEASQQSYLLTIELEEAQRLSEELLESVTTKQLLELIEQERNEQSFASIVQIKPIFTNKMDAFNYDTKLNESFQKVTEAFSNGERYQKVMKDITNHTIMRKYFKELPTDLLFKKDVLEQSQQILSQNLGIEMEGEFNED